MKASANNSAAEAVRREQIFFSRAYSASRRYAAGPFSPAAFLDLTLIILLFLATIHFSDLVVRPGINLDLPSAEFSGGRSFSSYNTILITLSREGMIFFNDELTTMEGLASSIAQAGHRADDTGLLIQADSSIDYGTIIRIFNMGVEAGLRDVTLATSIAEEALPEE
jgi:biopolymer transport protein ExbD